MLFSTIIGSVTKNCIIYDFFNELLIQLSREFSRGKYRSVMQYWFPVLYIMSKSLWIVSYLLFNSLCRLKIVSLKSFSRSSLLNIVNWFMLQQMLMTYSGMDIYWYSKLFWHSDYIVAYRLMGRKLPFIRNHPVAFGFFLAALPRRARGMRLHRKLTRVVLTWTDTGTNHYNLIINWIIIIIFLCNKIKI